jgi:branched-chain amino acid transport system substrate-binding protein
MRSITRYLCAFFAALVLTTTYAAEPIKIGVVTTMTGPWAEFGRFTVNGLQLALEDINRGGGVLGRQIELRVEDNQTTNPGTVLAFSKLAGEPGIVAIVGPIASTQIQAASPAIAKAGIPTMIGGTDPSLTHVNNRWVFRARPNDLYSSRSCGLRGQHSEAAQVGIVHATDAFGNGGAKALTDSLQALGITPVTDQGYTTNAQDFSATVLAIKKSVPTSSAPI